MADQRALDFIAVLRLQPLQLAWRLDVRRRHLEAQGSSEADQGLCDSRVGVLTFQVGDHAAIEADAVQPRLAQCLEGGETPAEVGQAQTHPQRLERLKVGQLLITVGM